MKGLLGPIPPDLLSRVKRGLMQLTPAEIRVFRCMTAGLGDPGIGAELAISTGTVEVHTLHIMQKAGCTRYQLIRAACELREDADIFNYFVHRTS